MDRRTELTQLLLAHRAILYGYIYACLRDHTDAEDVLQDVAVVVTESFEKLDRSSNFLPWALEIARRQVLVHLRKFRRKQVVSLELVETLGEAVARLFRR